MAQEPIQPVVDVRKQIHDLVQRAGYVEERYKNFEGRIKQLQQNVVEHNSEMRKVIRALDKEIVRIKATQDKMNDALRTLANEIRLRATKEDLAVLQKYVDHWNPFQFVTADQVEDIVKEVLERAASRRKSA